MPDAVPAVLSLTIDKKDRKMGFQHISNSWFKEYDYPHSFVPRLYNRITYNMIDDSHNKIKKEDWPHQK